MNEKKLTRSQLFCVTLVFWSTIMVILFLHTLIIWPKTKGSMEHLFTLVQVVAWPLLWFLGALPLFIAAVVTRKTNGKD